MLKRLDMRNFKVFTDQVFEFTPGTTSIVGPNGSGKTTILEAIEFALFKRITRKEKSVSKVEKMISHNKRKSKVLLDFVAPINRRQYRVERSIYPGETKADLFLEGDKEPIASGPRDVNDEIVKLLGVDRHAFSALTYVRQGEIDRLARQSPKSRRNDLYGMMGLGIYTKTSDRVHKRMQLVKKDISQRKETITRLQEIKEHLPSEEELEKVNSALASISKDDNLQEDLEVIRSVIDKVKESVTKVDHELFSTELTDEFENLKDESEISKTLKRILLSIPDIAESQLRPHIRSEAREIFRGIFGDRYSDLVIDDDYDVTLFDLRGNEVPLRAASGGEDVCVNFALRVGVNTALQKHSVAVPPPGLLILDEPGAGLDSQRRRWLPKAIQGLKAVEQVIVVTHMQELKESADRIIELTPQGKARQPIVELTE
ncbi:hypothetical protein EU537_03430 [Candidatus Thorarchaeota archaeon]|nr:MAG: hypothetical protein EU537_03430 [Candidatus Thorarchaeota archaeon]